MLGGPLRKCRRLWPIAVFAVSIVFVVAWRRSQLEDEKKYGRDEARHARRYVNNNSLNDSPSETDLNM